MASYVGHRRYSNSKVSSVKDADVVVREIRREHRSDERDRRKSRAPRREEVETVYVYRHVDGSKGRKDDSRQHQLRRSSDTVARHRYEQENRRPEVVGLKRRDSKRKYSDSKDRNVRPQSQERRGSGSSTHDHRPRPRSSSVREKPVASHSQPPLQRSRTSAQRSRPVSAEAPPPDRRQSQPPPFRRKPDRPPSLLGSIFSSPKPVPKPIPKPPPKAPVPEKLVECLTCISDVPASRSAKLACQQRPTTHASQMLHCRPHSPQAR